MLKILNTIFHFGFVQIVSRSTRIGLKSFELSFSSNSFIFNATVFLSLKAISDKKSFEIALIYQSSKSLKVFSHIIQTI
jgi:hypothetical protein